MIQSKCLSEAKPTRFTELKAGAAGTATRSLWLDDCIGVSRRTLDT